VPDDAGPSSGARILVVDDEPHIRRVVEVVLGKEGFDVVAASEGTEGLHILSQQRIDLVILDLLMPGSSGLEVLAKIRTTPATERMPVIILTAKGQDADREAALAGGANDFMTKPFSPKKLVSRIREILGAR
jgi:DNA-binding response OmpR family regulator